MLRLSHCRIASQCAFISATWLAVSPALAGIDEFEVELGQVVSDGVPAPGAGSITNPGFVTDWYFFKPLPGMLFEIKLLQENCHLEWECIGVQKGSTVFYPQPLCESQPPPFLTEDGEDYRIEVQSIQGGTGTYSFIVEQVNPIQTFEIELEQVVAQDVPGLGAGVIGEFAEIDKYIFQGKAGQHIYFDLLSDGCNVSWRCMGVNSMNWAACVGQTMTLPQDGQYVLEVFSVIGQTGAYSFLLSGVSPPQLFSIGIDELVTLDSPGPGAGHIEEPGDIDLYTFTIEQDTLLCFEQLTGSCSLQWATWNLDNDSMPSVDVFCGNQPGERLLTGPAQYMIRVKEHVSGEVGPYSFIIHPGKPADVAPGNDFVKGDCRVDVTDLLAVITQWGTCNQYVNCNADVTGNKIIDVDDLLAVINNWD